jgi:hypothetical protein
MQCVLGAAVTSLADCFRKVPAYATLSSHWLATIVLLAARYLSGIDARLTGREGTDSVNTHEKHLSMKLRTSA